MISIGLLKEKTPGETRVALSPESLKKASWFQKFRKDRSVFFERGCGEKAGFLDADYEAVGAVPLASAEEVWKQSRILLQIHRPLFDSDFSWKAASKGALWIGLWGPSPLSPGDREACESKALEVFALEAVPRISRAQSMDILSSQANLAGYRAVIEAAAHFPRIFPLLMTSAGSLKPAKVLVLGAGVAGLQAIATARRLGALVEAYDVRPEAQEQIRSLGAQALVLSLLEPGQEGAGVGAGGYAKALSPELQARQQALLAEVIRSKDIVIATANVPGKKAPLLVSEEALKGLRPGSVVVDLATPSGGNCAWSRPEEVVQRNGITVVGWGNYPARVPAAASAFWGQNVSTFLQLLISETGELGLSETDEIISATWKIRGGRIPL